MHCVCAAYGSRRVKQFKPGNVYYEHIAGKINEDFGHISGTESPTCVHSGWVCGFEDGSLKNSEAIVINAQTSPNMEKVIAGPNKVPAHPAAGYVINQHAWVSAKWAA